jgi:decaprenyl-phosphate phosphoribosyltransferase
MPLLQATARSHAPRIDPCAPAQREIGRPSSGRAPLRQAPVGVLLRACRPRQWVKNMVVALAPAAAGALTRPAVVAEVIGAVLAFCVLSSAVYLVNDVRDREQDRQHSRKRYRPVAAGELSPRGALRIAGLMAVLGIALSVFVQPRLGVVAICYLGLTTSYSVLWRYVVVADIVAVAAGFVLRAVAGGAATGVPLSRAFLIVTAACALFLVAGKRYAEMADGKARCATRATLGRYSQRFLGGLLAGAAAIGCVAYASWAFTRLEPAPWLELSTLPFVLWLGRYRMILYAGAGEAPEELILRDPALLALGALWMALFVGGVYGAR